MTERSTIELDVTGLSAAEIADIRAHVSGKQPGPDYYSERGWRCFHCGEVFHTPGGAELHFGKPADQPQCLRPCSWLILREPGKTPQRKGPFAPERLAATLREFMEARPAAFITVINLHWDGPSVEDGPECLELIDGRSAPTAAKHRASTRAAFAAYTSTPHPK